MQGKLPYFFLSYLAKSKKKKVFGFFFNDKEYIRLPVHNPDFQFRHFVTSGKWLSDLK